MYCVRSIMVVFLTQSACVFVTASVFIEGKCPELFFFFFFLSLLHFVFSDTHSDDIIHLEYKKCRAKPASDSSVLLTRLRSITPGKKKKKKH